MKKYILSLDQGTTSSRAILFDRIRNTVYSAQQEFKQIFPASGWVEHDPMDIWHTQLGVMQRVVKESGVAVDEIAAVGITNQRETTILWDKTTGLPLYNAIVWQDRRTASYCKSLKKQGLEELINEKTGLLLDPYFSGTKVKWILDKIEKEEGIDTKNILFGTVDTWLIYNLTKGNLHITDQSNASRTLLYNINTLEWDEEILSLLEIPQHILPEVRSSSEVYGNIDEEYLGAKIPIAGIAGDQQAALFGQLCTEKGMAKNTYGTGCFLVMNTGDEIVRSKNRLLSTIAWNINGKTTYAMEGSVFVAGAAIQWLRDGVGLIASAKESEELATSVDDNGGVYFVPALSGLGAPHWDPNARGLICGLSRGTTNAHITRAALEGICYQVYEVVEAMNKDLGESIIELRVDGGAVSNQFLLQFQADMLNVKVTRPKNLETTALGVAFFAGLAVGFWKDVYELQQLIVEDAFYLGNMNQNLRKELLVNWHKAVDRSKNWTE